MIARGFWMQRPKTHKYMHLHRLIIKSYYFNTCFWAWCERCISHMHLYRYWFCGFMNHPGLWKVIERQDYIFRGLQVCLIVPLRFVQPAILRNIIKMECTIVVRVKCIIKFLRILFPLRSLDWTGQLLAGLDCSGQFKWALPLSVEPSRRMRV